MRDVFYRDVSLFDEKGRHKEGKVLISFNASSFGEIENQQEKSLNLSARECPARREVLFSSYIATYFFDGQSFFLTLTRDQRDPLVFRKNSSQKDWVLVKNKNEKPISNRGNHSLAMLVKEFEARAM